MKALKKGDVAVCVNNDSLVLEIQNESNKTEEIFLPRGELRSMTVCSVSNGNRNSIEVSIGKKNVSKHHVNVGSLQASQMVSDINELVSMASQSSIFKSKTRAFASLTVAFVLGIASIITYSILTVPVEVRQQTAMMMELKKQQSDIAQSAKQGEIVTAENWNAE